MSPDADPWALHPGLRIRFETAGRQLVWEAVRTPAEGKGRRTARVAQLRDDRARTERWGQGASAGIAADSSPLGALLVVLEVLQRGPPSHLGAWPAGHDPDFPGGAVLAVWGDPPDSMDESPRPRDLIDLARYALE
jgi:hypothetical protein